MWHSKNMLADSISRTAFGVAVIVVYQRSLSTKYMDFLR